MTGIAGKPDEYFVPGRELEMQDNNAEWPISSFADYVAWAVKLATTANGVAGFKAHLDQLQYLTFRWQLLPSTRRSTLLQVLDEIFPQARWIYSRRNDKVRQAVSWWRSLQTQQWFDIDSQEIPPPIADPKYDFEGIATLHRRILCEESAWLEFFAAIGEIPLVVDYEDLAASYEATIAAVLQYIGLVKQAPAMLPPPRLRQQSDVTNEDWVDRYRRQVTSAVG
jgi:LPS sulfotransferase NodH